MQVLIDRVPYDSTVLSTVRWSRQTILYTSTGHHTLAQYSTSHSTIRYASTDHVDNPLAALVLGSEAPVSTIRQLSTAHRIAPYASAVPHIAYHHTLAQYRTSHSTIR
eukprot:3941906-Rhodomonas_salina.4